MKTILLLVAAVALCGLQVRIADAQGMPGGMGGGGRGQVPPGAGGMPEEPPTPSEEKPDVAVKKALKAANKALDKAKALEADAAATKDPDKKAKDMDRVGDAIQLRARCLHRGLEPQGRHGRGVGTRSATCTCA